MLRIYLWKVVVIAKKFRVNNSDNLASFLMVSVVWFRFVYYINVLFDVVYEIISLILSIINLL